MDDAKKDFISSVSHQLRGHISVVKWYTSMLLSGQAGKLNKEQEKYLTEIKIANQKTIDAISTLVKNYPKNAVKNL